MLWNNRVIWSEGMLLQQQHLQQQDRYWMSQLDARYGAQRNYGWGFSKLVIDEKLLALGKLGLLACEGIMPDGTPFVLPADDALPLPLDIAETVRDGLVVLALPLRRPGVSEMASATCVREDSYARYGRAQSTVFDANEDASDSAVMELGQLRLKLALAQDVAQGYATLGVACVVERNVGGALVLERRYSPPCLDYRVAPRLAGLVAELAGLLEQRGDVLAARLGLPGVTGTAEIADFLLLQAINRAEPLIKHFSTVDGLHPELLYRELLQLSGELAGFVKSARRPAAAEPYRHDALASCFEPLADELRRALSMVMDPQAVAIMLEQSSFGVRVGRVPDAGLFSAADFVLAVKADMPAETLFASLPAQMKVGPVEKIHDLVNLQLPGLALRRLPVAPRQLPFHAGYCYFALDAGDELWMQIAASAGVALHVAGEFPGLEMELWAIRH
ncbi:type VI secretion system baseplate subunit TssK [Trinickia sp. LjRoot230]|uniref:type VI secretion system baseplate subunit TssK n=1 Tax=Trinickia sp. LjRoot230 TaxID=3342288 RepID=UPI003ECE812F